MSWIQKLYETYENCQSMIGKVGEENEVPLLPICHTIQNAQINIVINLSGEFVRAAVVPRSEAKTIIPATEESAGRSGKKPACYPLCDKLQYIAGDFLEFGGEVTVGFTDDPHEPHNAYVKQLSDWCDSSYKHPKVLAILDYVKKGTVVADLVKEGILHLRPSTRLLMNQWSENDNILEIFKLLPGGVDNKGKKKPWQADAFVRWSVEVPGDPQSSIWTDPTIWESWVNYYGSVKSVKGLCYVTGEQRFMASQHPKKIRYSDDGAKIISSNDWSGFTFRGRFTDTKKHNTYQTCGVGFEVTQKSHSALRWLISRQGYRSGDQAIVAWATSGMSIPNPLDDPLSILGEKNLKNDDCGSIFTAQNLAIKLKKKIAGYKSDLGDASGVVVMGLDSATPGRIAITFYRELTGSEFLSRLEKWHDTCAWIHDYGYNPETKGHIRFVGAPAPKDIAEAAYGSKVDNKLKKTTVERLLPCIIDGQQIPRDIVDSAIRRASNRAGMEEWEWNKTLSIACAIFRKLNEKEGYDMALDENRKTRDYLYGRLLALADSLEQWALNEAKEDRQTNAARLMQRFADHPYSTWKIIELSLAPYKARLKAKSQKRQVLIDKVHAMFEHPDDYISDKKLSGEFLLGYHCQRESLRPKEVETTNESEPEMVTKIDE
ncbi:MAG: type I-C CRISPR-associated protein Cas8c/Csd1 [bacterium]